MSANPSAPSVPGATTSATTKSSLGQPAHQPPAFFPLLVERARGLAGSPPRPSGTVDLPPNLRDIGFEDYHNAVVFKGEKSLWHGEPNNNFEVQFFHMGHGYREPVAMFTVEGQTAKAFPFQPDLFNYINVQPPPPPDPATLNFTGLRVHTPINNTNKDEMFVVQGASYMRIVGYQDYYGLSNRGLAIDTGEPSGEEFPRFTEMYLEHPQPGSRSMWVMALLESKRSTGAYALLLTPGSPEHQTTTVEVHAQVFLRESVKVLGLAAITSMYLIGKDHLANLGDYRPEVHDSDGLVMLPSHNGDWIYRPLRNPPHTTVCTFRLDSPRGFGLVQRERNFAAYQDLHEKYENRPTAWIEPLNDWGAGSIRLLEIATKLESDDNIGAMWVPDQVKDNTVALSYRIHVGNGFPFLEPVGIVIGTRYADKGPGKGQFVVDFANLPTNIQGAPRADVTVTGGKLVGQQLVQNPFTGGYRVVVDVAKEQSNDIELRATVRDDHRALTETWSDLWQPTQ